MTTDLWMLVASAGLHWTLVLGAAVPRLYLNGIPWALGNRETPSVEVPAWAKRVQRTSDNMNENLILLAVLVLAAHVSGTADATSALGAQVFFGARVAHALLYAAGIPGLRTVAWAVSVVGLVMIGSVLF